jgi:S1-C subfamily serine protease
VSDLAEFGIVQRAYIGVSINDIDAKFAADKNINNLKGIYVNGVTIGGAAEDAGIKEGDVITKIEDNTVGKVSELQEQLSKYRPGDKINLIALRNNKTINLTVTLKSLDNTTSLIKKSEKVKKSISALGAVFEEISNDDLNKLKLNNGVKIKRLNPGKLAQIGIKEGFIITSIDKKKVNTINDISDLLENKTGTVIIEGFYPNGARAYYGFSL